MVWGASSTSKTRSKDTIADMTSMRALVRLRERHVDAGHEHAHRGERAGGERPVMASCPPIQ